MIESPGRGWRPARGLRHLDETGELPPGRPPDFEPSPAPIVSRQQQTPTKAGSTSPVLESRIEIARPALYTAVTEHGGGCAIGSSLICWAEAKATRKKRAKMVQRRDRMVEL